jgi:xylulokinase
MLLDTAGTASVLACCTDRFIADRRHRALLTMRSVVPGVWNPLAYIGGGGLALRWFRDTFGAGVEDYDAMAQLAGMAPPGCDGLSFSPHLGGRICPAAPQMRGAWIGFSFAHRKEHFARAVLESVALEYAMYLEIVRELMPDLTLREARVIGGGAQSTLWNQIKADVLATPYRRVLRSETATWGTALVAAKAADLIGDLAEHAEAHAAVCLESIQPDPAAVAVYKDVYRRQRAWQDRLLEGFARHD